MEKLIIGLDGDDSALRKKFENFSKFAQKKGKAVFGTGRPGGGGNYVPQSQSTGTSPAAQKAEENREKQRVRNEFKKHSMMSYYQAGRSQISKNMEMGSDFDELKSGGFYNVFAKRLESVKAKKDWVVDRWRDWNDKKGSSAPGTPGSPLPGMPGLPGGPGQSAQTINITAQSVNVGRGRDGIPGMPGVPPWRQQPGAPGPGSPGTPGEDGGGGGRGGLWSGLAKVMPYAGIPVAVAGGLMKLASEAGQRYGTAIGKQSGTWNALGGYVGGGGGYFANSEVAQGTLALGKTSGFNVYMGDREGETAEDFEKRGKITSEFMQFASSQGESLSTVMQGVGTLSKQLGRMMTGEDLGALRAYSNKAGFQNLRESEFLSGVSGYMNQLRSQGYGGADPMKFASFAASLQGSGITEDRRLGLAQTLEDKGRKNILGGGLFGNLGLVKALEESGGDLFAARRLMAKDPSKYMQSAMEFLGTDPESKEITAFLAEKEGIGPQTEIETLDINRNEPGPAPAMTKTSNPLIKSENKVDETYVQVGGKAFELSQKMVEDMANITAKLSPAIEAVSNRLFQLENGFMQAGEKLAQFTNLIAGIVTLDTGTLGRALRDLITR